MATCLPNDINHIFLLFFLLSILYVLVWIIEPPFIKIIMLTSILIQTRVGVSSVSSVGPMKGQYVFLVKLHVTT